MKAKKIYENINSVLKPKSYEDVKTSMPAKYVELVDDCYDKQLIEGLDVFKPKSKDELDKSMNDYLSKVSTSKKDFLEVLREIILESNDFTNVSELHADFDYDQMIYGFSFETKEAIRYKAVSWKGKYRPTKKHKLKLSIEFQVDDNGFYLCDNVSRSCSRINWFNAYPFNVFSDSKNIKHKHELLNEIKDILSLYNLTFPNSESLDFINEDVKGLFKPKSEEDIKNEFIKKYPAFYDIISTLFTTNDLNLNTSEDNVEAHIAFTTTDRYDDKHTFLIKQDYHRTLPMISYLDKSTAGQGFAGAFVNQQTVITPKDVEKYVEKVMHPIYDRRTR